MAIINPITIGATIGAVKGLFDTSSEETEEALNELLKGVGEAQEQLQTDYKNLLSNFDQSLTQFRTESITKRKEAKDQLKLELETNTNSMIDSFGPLNDDSKARIRTLMNHPVYNRLLEYDLGTTDNDLNLGLSSIMGALTLERELQALQSQARTAVRANRLAALGVKEAQPEFLEDVLQGIQLALPFAVK